jgi:hypothetical protein
MAVGAPRTLRSGDALDPLLALRPGRPGGPGRPCRRNAAERADAGRRRLGSPGL